MPNLFKIKKKEEMPTFSENIYSGSNEPRGELDLPEFPGAKDDIPSYESEFNNIKQAVQKPVEFKKPVKSAFQPKPKPTFQPRQETFKSMPLEHHFESGEKPIFVKIEDYKSAVKAIDLIKEKLDEANNTLEHIERVRQEEERELDLWRNDIERVKDKLMFIDEKLFEV